MVALKAVEPELEGLDGLLEVFDSMVEDQVRCMNENRKGKGSLVEDEISVR